MEAEEFFNRQKYNAERKQKQKQQRKLEHCNEVANEPTSFDFVQHTVVDCRGRSYTILAGHRHNQHTQGINNKQNSWISLKEGSVLANKSYNNLVMELAEFEFVVFVGGNEEEKEQGGISSIA